MHLIRQWCGLCLFPQAGSELSFRRDAGANRVNDEARTIKSRPNFPSGRRRSISIGVVLSFERWMHVVPQAAQTYQGPVLEEDEKCSISASKVLADGPCFDV